MKNFLKAIWEFGKMVIIALIIVLPVRYFLIQPFYVKGASMEPSFYDKQYLVIDEISYRLHQPVRGDVIVFHYPYDVKEFYIKRVIGLPGETVEIKDNNVYIYNDENPAGFKIDEPYLSPNIVTAAYSEDKVVLGDHEYYVLGDNRIASKDSRIFGPVDKKFITGRVFFRGWPLNKFGLIQSTQY